MAGGGETLGRQDFYHALDELNIHVNGWEAKALLDRFEVDEDGEVRKVVRSLKRYDFCGEGGSPSPSVEGRCSRFLLLQENLLATTVYTFPAKRFWGRCICFHPDVWEAHPSPLGSVLALRRIPPNPYCTCTCTV